MFDVICVFCGVIEYLTYRAEKCPTNDETAIKARGRIKITSVMFAGNFGLSSGKRVYRGGRGSGLRS